MIKWAGQRSPRQGKKWFDLNEVRSGDYLKYG